MKLLFVLFLFAGTAFAYNLHELTCGMHGEDEIEAKGFIEDPSLDCPETGKVGEKIECLCKAKLFWGLVYKYHDYDWKWGDGSEDEDTSYDEDHKYRAAGTYKIECRESCPFGLYTTGYSKVYIKITK